MSDGLEKRGVSLALLEAVSAFTLGQNAEPGHWTIGRLGALVVGNHEILKAGNRWGVAECDEGEATRLATLTFRENCSLIDVLERYHPDPGSGGRLDLCQFLIGTEWLCILFRALWLRH